MHAFETELLDVYEGWLMAAMVAIGIRENSSSQWRLRIAGETKSTSVRYNRDIY